MTDASDSTVRSLHALVEHYTPDGTLGRLLLGSSALVFAPVAFLASSSVLLAGAYLPVLVMSLFALLAGVAAFPLGIAVLWPVYLSLIGNLSAPDDYAHASGAPAKVTDTPEALLKRQYAAGELDREEFERRLDDVMETPRRDDWRSGSGDETNARLESSSIR